MKKITYGSEISVILSSFFNLLEDKSLEIVDDEVQWSISSGCLQSKQIISTCPDASRTQGPVVEKLFCRIKKKFKPSVWDIG